MSLTHREKYLNVILKFHLKNSQEVNLPTKAANKHEPNL